MTMLFDTSPDEVPDRKRSRKRAEAAVAVAEPEMRPACGWVVAQSRGTVDADCHNPACGCTVADIIDEQGDEWLVSCWICGAGYWMPVVAGVLEPATEEFRFAGGRFDGLTPAGAAATPRGLEYVRWAAGGHKSPEAREACQRHLDRIATGG